MVHYLRLDHNSTIALSKLRYHNIKEFKTYLVFFKTKSFFTIATRKGMKRDFTNKRVDGHQNDRCWCCNFFTNSKKFHDSKIKCL